LRFQATKSLELFLTSHTWPQLSAEFEVPSHKISGAIFCQAYLAATSAEFEVPSHKISEATLTSASTKKKEKKEEEKKNWR
jgi:hypothetical protein